MSSRSPNSSRNHFALTILPRGIRASHSKLIDALRNAYIMVCIYHGWNRKVVLQITGQDRRKKKNIRRNVPSLVPVRRNPAEGSTFGRMFHFSKSFYDAVMSGQRAKSVNFGGFKGGDGKMVFRSYFRMFKERRSRKPMSPTTLPNFKPRHVFRLQHCHKFLENTWQEWSEGLPFFQSQKDGLKLSTTWYCQ